MLLLFVEDSACIKQLLKLLFDSNRQVKSCMPLLKDISRDIHIVLGDIEQVIDNDIVL